MYVSSVNELKLRGTLTYGYSEELLRRAKIADKDKTKAIAQLTARLNLHVQMQAAQSANVIPQTRRKLAGVHRQIENITAAIADGLYPKSKMSVKLKDSLYRMMAEDGK